MSSLVIINTHVYNVPLSSPNSNAGNLVKGNNVFQPSTSPPCLADNLVEGNNVFELVASKERELKARMARKWNTAMSKNLAFGPSVNDIPGFVLTAKWTQLKVSASPFPTLPHNHWIRVLEVKVSARVSYCVVTCPA